MKDNQFVLRVDSELREDVNERASRAGVSSSEWIRWAIENLLENEDSEIPTVEEIEDMKFDELTDLVEDLGLEIDADDYDTSGIFSSPSYEDTENLREEILLELGLSVEASDEELEEE